MPEVISSVRPIEMPVSVPRRALRGHAHFPPCAGVNEFLGFSAPKGVERACPEAAKQKSRSYHCVSVPRRALRGHARKMPGSFCVPLQCFSAPKGVERACPAIPRACEMLLDSFQCPEGR